MSMPWAYVREPSLAIGILKAVLDNKQIPCHVVDAPLRLLKWMDAETYRRLSTVVNFGVNDFLFTREFEPQISLEQLQVLRRICCDDFGLVENHYKRIAPPEGEMDTMIRLRQSVIPRFLEEMVGELDMLQYALIGFTCQYDQIWSSLACARKMKRRQPSAMIVFGGASVAEPVGPYLQTLFPEIDVVAYGDGETVIGPLYRAACGEIGLAEVPNISYRNAQGEIKTTRHVTLDLAESPAPNYDAWFEQTKRLQEERGVRLPLDEVPVESSRGCWWGLKAQCTFCGQEHQRRGYRVKPASVVVAELDALHGKYGARTFRFNEDIMPRSYVQDFWPVLAQRGAPYRIHYEIKANQTARDIAAYARGGAFYMQPGIESFSTPVLKRMNKGVTALQNIFTLYTLMRHGIFCFYNILWGMPGDRPEDYFELLQTVPCLYHLIPPGGVSRVFLARYSPLFQRPEEFGLDGEMVPHWRYEVIFSREYRRAHKINLEHCVHYFENNGSRRNGELELAVQCLQHQILHWRELYYRGQSRLSYSWTSDGLLVRDDRFGRDAVLHRFDPTYGDVYEALLDRVTSRPTLHSALSSRHLSSRRVDTILEELCQARIVLREGDHYVGLALPEDYYRLPVWWLDDKIKKTMSAMASPLEGSARVDRKTGADLPSNPTSNARPGPPRDSREGVEDNGAQII